jgi:hypothetical protein
MIGQPISHYKILEKIGECGMSQNFPRVKRVDEVLSVRLGRHGALRQIPLERSGRGRHII